MSGVLAPTIVAALAAALVVGGSDEPAVDVAVRAPGVIEGVVLAPDGVPIAGAEVLVSRPGWPEPLSLYHHADVEALGPDTVPAEIALMEQRSLLPSVRSDARGCFRVDDVPEGGARLYLRAEHHAPVRVGDVRPDVAPFTVVLPDEACWHVAVVHDDGRPTAGATLRAVANPIRDYGLWSESNEGRGRRLEVLVGEAAARREPAFEPGPGRYLVCGAGMRRTLVDVDLPGYASVRRWLPGLAPGTTGSVELVVPSTSRLGVRVVDVRGLPLEGAGVRIQGRVGMFDVPASEQVLTTGPDGRVTILVGDLRAGVAVSAPGFGESVGRDVMLSAGDDALVDVVLEPEAVVQGVVLGEDGRPSPGRSVRLVRTEDRGTHPRAGWHGTPPSTTDERGRFRFDRVGRGLHVVTLPDIEARLVDAVPGEVHEVVYHTGSARLSGRVTRDGAPVAGASVIARLADSPAGHHVPFQTTARTDTDGRYAMSLYYEGRFLVEATSPSRATEDLPVSVGVEAFHGSVATLDLALPPSR